MPWSGRTKQWQDQGGGCGVGKVADSGCTVKVEPTGFSDRLDIKVGGTGVEDEAMIFAPSNWKDGSAIN